MVCRNQSDVFPTQRSAVPAVEHRQVDWNVVSRHKQPSLMALA